MNKQTFDAICSVLRTGVTNRYTNGTTQNYLSTEARVGLMIDKLQRWFETRNYDELVEHVVDGFLLLTKASEGAISEAVSASQTSEDAEAIGNVFEDDDEQTT